MQPILRAFLALYLGHLLTDFVFQSHRLVSQKMQRQSSAYIRHGLIHYFLVMGIVSFFVPGSVVRPFVHAIVGGLTIAHLLIDLCKVELARKYAAAAGAAAYLADQLLHLLTAAFAAWWMAAGSLPRADFPPLMESMRRVPDKFLAALIVYVLVVFGGGYLIRLLTRSLLGGVQSHHSERDTIAAVARDAQLQNAGLYIGWLERFLVLTASCCNPRRPWA